MVYSTEYCWVVLCKNYRFPRKQNMFFGHASLWEKPMPFNLAPS